MITFVLLTALLLFWYVLYVRDNALEIRGQADGELYLKRWHLFRCKRFRVFLHRIYKPDADRHLHNHPWPNAVGIVLRGGYAETRSSCNPLLAYYYGSWGDCNDGRVNVLYPWTYHRITRVLPNTWTLFIAGRRSREWGFLTPDGHVDWRTYLGLPADATLED